MGRANQFRPNWFELYAAAILEADMARIPERVATARSAIAERVVKLEAGERAAHQEPRDLQDALNKLQILLGMSRELSQAPHHSHLPSSPEQARLRV